jgi:SAM-dependent methyltransferase
MTNRRAPYSSEWFELYEEWSTAGAKCFLPMVLEWTDARSVVDVGCGLGAWLSVALELGVEEILGIDGPWVSTDDLHVPSEYFRHADLADPLILERCYDLALSVEVAEHLPESAAPTFVRTLSSLAPVVLFSAAIPGQGGTNHFNEQWPSYWASLFEEHDFVAIDALRPRVWRDETVPDFYRQNMLIFRRRDWRADDPILGDDAPGAQKVAGEWPMSLVHPSMLTSLPHTRDIPGLFMRRLRDKVRRWAIRDGHGTRSC